MRINILQVNNKAKYNPLGWLIKKFQKTNYSHYILQVESEGMDVFYDTTSAGVCMRSAAYFDKHYITHNYYYSTKKISYVEFMEFWTKHEAKRYGFTQLIGIALKVLGIAKNNPFGKGAKRLICNEMVVLFLNRFYYTHIIDTDSLDLNDTDKLLRKVLQ